MPNEKEVVLTESEWKMFCEIMRSLTWGKECMGTWHCLRERVTKRLEDGPETQDVKERGSKSRIKSNIM